MEIINEFLPEQMSDIALEDAVREVIALSEASSIKDMGQVMGLLREKFTGRMDFGKASAMVKEKLT